MQVKVHVRKLLPSGLADAHSKVRSTVAYAIAAIAHWDWPEDWPELFDQLMLALNSPNSNLVHGSMRVLSGQSHVITPGAPPSSISQISNLHFGC